MNASEKEQRVLFVSATRSEAAALPQDCDVLVTGIGTVNAAIAVTRYLAQSDHLPEVVVNIGTAGGLKDGLAGVFEIESVHRHDVDAEALEAIAGFRVPNGIDLETTGLLPSARLATGDAFIDDSTTRERIVAKAELVDMEGYAVARAAEEFHVPVRLLKQISDQANEQSAQTWSGAVPTGAEQLAEAARSLGLIA